MNTLEIILATISMMLLVEGLILAFRPKSVIRGMKRIFKNRKTVVKAGLIEIMLALLVLFLIAL